MVLTEKMPWDYDKKSYRKQAKAAPLFHLERLIQYGLGKEKLKKEMLKKYLPSLKIPQDYRAFLTFIVWGKKS